jgi:hypothetical protein
MGGFPWRDSRVQIRQTSKQVVVQRCALTSDRKPAPRPPAPAHPCQGQYLWTLKMGAPRIRLQDRSRTCDAQDARAVALQSANFGALLGRAAPGNGTWSHEPRKKLESFLPCRCTSRHSRWRCKKAGEGACRAVLAAEIAGQPLHAQRSLAQRDRFPPIRIRTLFGN